MKRIATISVMTGWLLASQAAGQTFDFDDAPPPRHVTPLKFPLRHAYIRLHPDRVSVLEPRFDVSPAESAKRLVTYSADAITLYDPVTNLALWPAPVKCAYEPALLLLDENRLVFATNTQVFCAARSDGRILWRVGEKTSTNPEDDPEWQVMLVDFACAADRLVCANDRRELTCINTKDGSIVWRVPDGPGNPGYLTADSQFVVSYDENAASGSLTSRHLETGNKFKSVPYDRETILQFIRRISDTQLLAVTSKQIVSFDSGSLALNWRVADRPVIFTATLLVDGGNIFVSDDGKTVSRFLASTGERKWRTKPLATRNDNVLWTAAAESVVVAATPRALAAYDIDSGRRLWRRSGMQFMNEQSPVVIQDAVLTYERLAPPKQPASQPAASQSAGHPLLIRRHSLPDGAGGEPPGSALITVPVQSFGGLYVRNHAIIILDGNRHIGYVDATKDEER